MTWRRRPDATSSARDLARARRRIVVLDDKIGWFPWHEELQDGREWTLEVLAESEQVDPGLWVPETRFAALTCCFSASAGLK
jgi:hypothetical protein